MQGKKGIITGIINERSLAFGITKELAKQGAELIVTYPSDNVKEKISELVEKNNLNCQLILHCDVKNEKSIDSTFAEVKKKWESIDFLVHAIAFSDKNELNGPYINTSLENFLSAMHISCYSFTALAREAAKIMSQEGSLLTLSYYGAEKVMPNYNVMGLCKAALEASVRYLACDLGPKNIRVNAISAGPIRTLASSGIKDFHYIQNYSSKSSPLRRNVTIEEIGKAALFLLSNLSSGITGEILHVDSGYNVVGMKPMDIDVN
ncbi:enoyl-ACP reductase [Candidatus Mesenet endosymbiont of Agriotes lineatus]|uniref:enoyl-ACP reductase FabI n=1 Tax=Candidatus Mesenet endosymbiont of Agriotes lineatus TaxID=3077948 RepID=UPI0030D2CC65